MIRVLDMYNKLATITGFPQYSTEMETEDITRFLLEQLSEALQNIVDNLYTSNNVLERTDTIKLIKDKNLYGVSGIIKSAQLIESNGKVIDLPFNTLFPKNREEERKEDGSFKYTGKPRAYVMQHGYMRILPVPDKAYKVKVTLSTTDLVIADNDIARDSIEHINDFVLANAKFCELVVLRAATLIFARCKNANAEIYQGLYEDRRRTFIEHDFGSTEQRRGFNRNGGHYDSRRGLLD